MVNLVAELRRMTNTSSDYTDDQLQSILDRTREIWLRVQLDLMPIYANGSYSYLDYSFHLQWVETVDGWAVKDAGGAAAPSNTVNFDAGIVTFAADTGAKPYFIDA